MINKMVLLIIVIIMSGCINGDDKGNVGHTVIPNLTIKEGIGTPTVNPASTLNEEISAPTIKSTIKSTSKSASKSVLTIPSKIQLEEYQNYPLYIKKPKGWEVIIAGSCAQLSFLVRDRDAPQNQLFFFIEYGPLYFSAQQKETDRVYMSQAGYIVPWYEQPVVYPFNHENFLQQFHLSAKTRLAKDYMRQIPELENVQIVSSINAASPIGNAKFIRALFDQNRKISEGIFYIVIMTTPYAGYAGIDKAYLFTGVSADKDKFKYYENELLESIKSAKISDDYVSDCIRKTSSGTPGAVDLSEVSKTISETADIMTGGWDSRTKSENIMSEKWSDARMGRERVYNTDTDEVYHVTPDWYEKTYEPNRYSYDMSNLQQLPSESEDLWGSPMIDGSNIH